MAGRPNPQILQKQFAPTLFLKCIIKKQTLNKIVAAQAYLTFRVKSDFLKWLK